jgi:hypothetical protein
MISPKFSVINVAGNTTATRYYAIDSGTHAAAITADTSVRVPISIPGTLRGLYFSVSVAPGAGASWVLTLFKNGASTGLTATISGASPTLPATDLINTVSVSAGDRFSWQLVPSAGTAPAAANIYVSCYFDSTNAGESFMSGGMPISANTANYWSPTGGALSATESDVSLMVPTAGTIDYLYLEASSNVGAGNTDTMTLVLNGTPTALTTNVSGASQTVATPDTTNSVAVVKGDLISMALTVAGTPTARILKWGMRFTPTVNGESLIMSRSTSITVSNIRYLNVVGGSGNNSTEALPQIAVPYASVLKKFAVSVVPAAGASKQWTFVDRKGGVTGNLSVVISGASQTSNDDPTDTTSYAAGDLFNWMSTPSGTPATITKGMFSAVFFVSPSTAYTSTLSETITFTDTLSKTITKVFSDTVTYTDTVLKSAAKILSDTVTYTDTLTKRISRALTETVTLSDIFAAIKNPGGSAYFQTLNDTITFTDTLIRRTSKSLSDAITFTDTLAKRISRSLFETITFTDIVALANAVVHILARYTIKLRFTSGSIIKRAATIFSKRNAARKFTIKLK